MIQAILCVFLCVFAALMYYLVTHGEFPFKWSIRRRKQKDLYGASLLAQASVARTYKRWKKMEDLTTEMRTQRGLSKWSSAAAIITAQQQTAQAAQESLITAQQQVSQAVQEASVSVEQVAESFAAVAQASNLMALGGLGMSPAEPAEPSTGDMRYFNGRRQVYVGNGWVEVLPKAAQKPPEPEPEPEKPDIAIRPSEDPDPRILDFGHGGRREQKSSSS